MTLLGKLPVWVRSTRDEWERLEGDGHLCPRLTTETFSPTVLETSDMYIVMFTGVSDVQSQQAKANFLRLASDLFRVTKVAMVTCQGDTAALCRSHGVPQSNYPHFWVYPTVHPLPVSERAACES